jgi:hypothetical protein
VYVDQSNFFQYSNDPTYNQINDCDFTDDGIGQQTIAQKGLEIAAPISLTEILKPQIILRAQSQGYTLIRITHR